MDSFSDTIDGKLFRKFYPRNLRSFWASAFNYYFFFSNLQFSFKNKTPVSNLLSYFDLIFFAE